MRSVTGEFARPGLVSSEQVGRPRVPRAVSREQQAGEPDALDPQVGDTLLVRARELERLTGLRQLYLKLECDNPTHSSMDRIASVQVHEAQALGLGGLVVPGLDQRSVSVAHAARLASLRCVVVVPEGAGGEALSWLEDLGASIVRRGADGAAAAEHARRLCAVDGLYDAGAAHQSAWDRAGSGLAMELYDELCDAPATISLPASLSSLERGLVGGFGALQDRGWISRVPEVIVAAGGPGRLDDPGPQDLARWLGEALALEVSEAAVEGLAALLERHASAPLRPDTHVAVISGAR